jgi:DNA-binding LacI/PurR family transcriptional regulator
MGERTAELLLDLINGIHLQAPQLVTRPLLIARSSTRPLQR